MFDDRFQGYTGRDDHDDDISRIIERYVLGVASVGKTGLVGRERFLDVDEPLEDVLPEAITPEYADYLTSWLAPALDRAYELLQLLIRRGREKDAPP